MRNTHRILSALFLLVVLPSIAFAFNITVVASGVSTNIRIVGYDYIGIGGTGTYDLSAGTYTLSSSPGGNFAAFGVELDGTVSYDPLCEGGVLTGAGTSTLTVVGHPITVDASGVSTNIKINGLSYIDGTATFYLPPDTIFDYQLYSNPGGIINGSQFTVFADGTCDPTEVTFEYGTIMLIGAYNAAPIVGDITAPVDPIQVGTEIAAIADFTDPDTLDTHTAEWDWGDSSTSPGTVDEANESVGGSHTYTAAGVYTVTLTVTDDDGDSDQSVFQYVVIYDPDGGFVTGGGWIDSPAGAYTADPELTGKANFGFVSKYKKGTDIPTGNTQFSFRVADLKFHSTEYQWLVVAGPHAKFKGDGTINNDGNYGFMVTATDGELNGGGGVDKFRIKIWDKNDGDAVAYDNQMGDADGTDATHEIGGGSIVIHGDRSAAPAFTRVAGFELAQNYPNPFNPETWIPYQLAGDVDVIIRICDVTGKLISTLDLGHKPAGAYITKDKAAYWDGKNEAGERVASGIYFYSVQAGGFTATEKMIIAQ